MSDQQQQRRMCNNKCTQRKHICTNYHILLSTFDSNWDSDLCIEGNMCNNKTCNKLHITENSKINICSDGNLCRNAKCIKPHFDEKLRRKNLCSFDKNCKDRINCILMHTPLLCKFKNNCSNGKCKDQHPNEDIRQQNLCDSDKDCQIKDKCILRHSSGHSKECLDVIGCLFCNTKITYAPTHYSYDRYKNSLPTCQTCKYLAYSYKDSLSDGIDYYEITCYAYYNPECKGCIDRKKIRNDVKEISKIPTPEVFMEK